MWTKLKAVALAGVVAAAALAPLYGDPRATLVTHAEWARMLLRALALDEVAQRAGRASDVFSVLSWKSSLRVPASRYLDAEGVDVLERPARVAAVSKPGEVSYVVVVLSGGDYRLRLRMAGNPAAPATAELTAAAGTVPVKSFPVVPAAASGWIDAGAAHLDPGTYTASVALPPGTSLEALEVAPPCLNAIEPLAGWKATAVLDAADLAVTMVQALGKESELPPAAAPIEVAGSDFQATGLQLRQAVQAAGPGQGLRAGPTGLQAVAIVELPEAGLYTVRSFGLEGGGQRWLADSCRKSVLCSREATAAGGPEWREVMTAEFAAGRHVFAVTMGAGAVVERLRIERKKSGAADYGATLRRLGFEPGPDGPVSRGKAVEAARFLSGQRAPLLKQGCGDVVVASSAPAGGDGASVQPAPVAGPPRAPGTSGQGPAVGTAALVPPQIPASPVLP